MSLQGLIRMHGKVCTVQRANVTLDSGRATKDEFLPHLMEIKVFIQDSSGDEQERYGFESARKRATGYALPGQDIRAKDRIVCDSPVRTFDIQTSAERTCGNASNNHIRLELEETDGPTT